MFSDRLFILLFIFQLLYIISEIKCTRVSKEHFLNKKYKSPIGKLAWIPGGEECKKENREGRNLLMTTFFTSKLDPQRKVDHSTRDPFSYFGRWVQSINKGCWDNVNAIIFHDGGLNEQFTKDYNLSFLKYVKVNFTTTYSTNDQRFFTYLDFLRKEKENIDKVYMTDAFDVVVVNNPFEYDLKYNHTCKILTGSETRKMKVCGWCKGVMQNCFGEQTKEKWEELNGNLHVYNPGVFGGNVREIIKLLSKIVTKLRKTHRYTKKGTNCNLMIYNMILQSFYKEEELCHGYPLHSIFKRYENPSNPRTSKVAFIHK